MAKILESPELLWESTDKMFVCSVLCSHFLHSCFGSTLATFGIFQLSDIDAA
ncbi:MAG: hypothetical protein ACK4XY_11535 [Chloroherpetonaceae bacterium]